MEMSEKIWWILLLQHRRIWKTNDFTGSEAYIFTTFPTTIISLSLLVGIGAGSENPGVYSRVFVGLGYG
jgi:hypothetical protein